MLGEKQALPFCSCVLALHSADPMQKAQAPFPGPGLACTQLSVSLKFFCLQQTKQYGTFPGFFLVYGPG